MEFTSRCFRRMTQESEFWDCSKRVANKNFTFQDRTSDSNNPRLGNRHLSTYSLFSALHAPANKQSCLSTPSRHGLTRNLERRCLLCSCDGTRVTKGKCTTVVQSSRLIMHLDRPMNRWHLPLTLIYSRSWA